MTTPAKPAPPPATPDQYTGLAERLLPPGPLWALTVGGELRGILGAFGDELGRVHDRLLALLEEADPRTANETLGAWERILRLPDPVFGTPATTAARQALVHARWTARGGQTAAYYIALAATIGQAITIQEPCRPFRAGDRVGAACFGDAWAYGWRVRATNGPLVSFRAGARAGYRVVDARTPALEALLWRYAPAHTIPCFTYNP